MFEEAEEEIRQVERWRINRLCRQVILEMLIRRLPADVEREKRRRKHKNWANLVFLVGTTWLVCMWMRT